MLYSYKWEKYNWTNEEVLRLAGGKHLLGKRSHFGIQPGDTLLVLGDDRHGLVVTRPDVIQDVADRIFEKLDEEKE